MSNFIPNEIKTIIPGDPPWIIKTLKTMLKRNNSPLKNYKENIAINKKTKLDLRLFAPNVDSQLEAKLSYLSNLGTVVNYSSTSHKS